MASGIRGLVFYGERVRAPGMMCSEAENRPQLPAEDGRTLTSTGAGEAGKLAPGANLPGP